jgi:alkanesulfonate monooxygenase
MRPLEFGWYLPTHGDTTAYGVDVGCHSFCLSGYLHDEEAERFGRLIRPILAENNRGRLAA